MTAIGPRCQVMLLDHHFNAECWFQRVGAHFHAISTQQQPSFSRIARRPLCRLWVNNGLSRPTAATSAFRGKADANDAKADIGQRMSAFGGRADVARWWLELPFLAIRRSRSAAGECLPKLSSHSSTNHRHEEVGAIAPRSAASLQIHGRIDYPIER